MMGILQKFHLYNAEKEKVAVVVPYTSKGTYMVQGYTNSILRHVNKEMSKEELISFKESHNLLRAEELGQLNIFEIL